MIATHFDMGHTDLSYATESNLHFAKKDAEKIKKIDPRKMLTNQFDFGDLTVENKDFYRTTYSKEVSSKNQRHGIIGQPVTLLSQKNESQI